MIRFKAGVIVHPDSVRSSEMMRILDVAAAEAPAGLTAGYDVIVTSGYGGKHSPGSSHYSGKAFDVRIRDFPGQVETWVDRITRALGDRYFVLLEPNHIHVHRFCAVWNGG